MSARTAREWSGVDVTISAVDAELAHLRRETVGDDGQPHQRTSVMTHIAWVPPAWVEAAERTLEGLGERHPSRTVILVPIPDEPDGIDARLSVRSFPVGDRAVSSEVIELTLRGERSLAPASVVLPLTISDLPVFLRWRGEPRFGETQWEQLVGVADRVIVDSSEWENLRYHELADVFELTAVSDIAWARTDELRISLAAHWPAIASQEILVSGPRAEAALLRGWLSARLDRDLAPVQPAGELGVRLAGEEVVPQHADDRTPSDLLSAELDKLVRDLIYEQAVFAQGALP
jgi:glucose-6-phosphate dehydrogenase assembly protein OpcA